MKLSQRNTIFNVAKKKKNQHFSVQTVIEANYVFTGDRRKPQTNSSTVTSYKTLNVNIFKLNTTYSAVHVVSDITS